MAKAWSRGSLAALLWAALPAAVGAAESAATAHPASAPSQRPLPCQPPTFGRDRLTLVCALDEGSAPQRVHVRVHLTGSHDDTTAALDVAIGDAPVACDAGSKTSTEGEDGDVTLDCRFSAPIQPGAATVVRVSARWFHAQYVGIEVNGRRP
jgi:hypothetical protein